MEIALVELPVVLPTRPFGSLTAAIQSAIMAGVEGRAAQVRNVLESSALANVDAIVFPGWTLIGERPPEWIIGEAGRRLVVFEMLAPDAAVVKGKSKQPPVSKYAKAGFQPTWRTFVVLDGRVVLDGVVQRIATSEQATTDECATIVKQVLNNEQPHRSFQHRSLGTVSLLICGEVNIVPVRDDVGAVPHELARSARLFINPAHTPSRLPKMQTKRKALSGTGVLVTTANTHSRWRLRGEDGLRSGRSVAAECYVGGARRDRSEAHGAIIGDATALVFPIEP